jgi:hypothetical protein
MCQLFVFQYSACGHVLQDEIDIEFRPRANESCKQGIAEIIRSDNLEFCPNCFLLADPRSALPDTSPFKHYLGTGCEENRDWAKLGPEADFWFVRDGYIRAGLFNPEVPRDEDIRLFVTAEGPKLDGKRRTVLSNVFGFLLWDFWERLNQGAHSPNPPSRDQKILILQLQKVLEDTEIDELLTLPAFPSTSSASSNELLLEFRNYKGEFEKIEKEKTPAWMLSLLGAVEVGQLAPLTQGISQHGFAVVMNLFEQMMGRAALDDILRGN